MMMPLELATIRDKHGADYALRIDIDEKLWRIDVLDDRTRAGLVFALPAGGTLRLQDIRLNTEMLHPESIATRVLRGIFRIRQKTTSYRHRGLGPVLLRHFVELARQHGFRRIEGHIKAYDFGRDAWLPDWYRAQGFTVRAVGESNVPFILEMEL